MVKRLLVMLLALSMLMACVVPTGVFAAATYDINIDVPADIEVKNAIGGVYTDRLAPVSVIAGNAMPRFDFIANLDMSPVRDAFSKYYSKAYIEKLFATTLSDAEYAAYKADLSVKGQMTTTINVPAGFIVPDAFLAASGMYGYGPVEKVAAHSEVSRNVSDVSGGKKIEIVTKVVDPSNPTVEAVPAETLASDIDKYLGDIYLESLGNTVAIYGSYKITGSVTGYTEICYQGIPVAKINYKAVQEASKGENELAETVAVVPMASPEVPGGGSGGNGGGTGGVISSVKIDFSVNGDKTVIDPIVKKGSSASVNLDDIVLPEIPGYKFEGVWYSDAGRTTPVSGNVTVNKDTTFYAYYISTKVPSVFADDVHYGYIQGYPEGTVKPLQNVSREEVTAMLYRLLKDDVREGLKVKTNNFSDVDASRWSNTEISTMVNGKYITGYPDGTFKPGKHITRAEFATIITRFFDNEGTGFKPSFSDVSGHWAEEYIVKAAEHMMILGYNDGTFKPDKFITRAEAMTIINRLLVRYVNKEGLHADAKQWPDNLESAWYYYNVLEATNSHEYVRQADGYNEKWTGMLENRDWRNQ